MSKSDDDIYARVGVENGTPSIVRDAEPLNRERPPGLLDSGNSEQSIDDYDWAVATVGRQSHGTTTAYVACGHVQAGREPGTIRLIHDAHSIRRMGTASLTRRDVPVYSMEPVTNTTVRTTTSYDDVTGELLIDEDPYESDRYGLSPSGPADDPLSEVGNWFVARDASGRSASRGDSGSHCYETYFPANALQFRNDNHFNRPPVEVVEDQCYGEDWSGPSSGRFGVIATELVRVTADEVPASPTRQATIKDNV